jgi:hypothetical protein
MTTNASAGHRRTALRWLAAAESVAGSLLLARPHVVGRAVAGDGTAPAAWLLRVLGARLLAQGLALLRDPGRRMATAGAAADAAHGLSMVALAAGSPRYRRPALISAAAAVASAGAAVATEHVTRGAHR